MYLDWQNHMQNLLKREKSIWFSKEITVHDKSFLRKIASKKMLLKLIYQITLYDFFLISFPNKQ